MKDANLKAIEELESINYIINHILKYDEMGSMTEEQIYRAGFNNACKMITGYIERAIAKMESEVML